MTLEQPDFPYTTKQVNRAGERIRRARTRGVDPTDTDLGLLDRFRAAHYPTLREVHGRFTRLVHDKLGLEPVAPVTARPLKTPEAIIAKLVRVKTRLATMQDIAGTRATVPSLALQDRIVAAALEEFAESGARLVKDSREDGDKYGYRAVHVVVTITGRLAEIQVRTTAQDAWAQIVEKLDEAMGTDLKHGRGRPEFHAWLHHLGDALRDADLGRPFEIPQAPFDQS